MSIFSLHLNNCVSWIQILQECSLNGHLRQAVAIKEFITAVDYLSTYTKDYGIVAIFECSLYGPLQTLHFYVKWKI